MQKERRTWEETEEQLWEDEIDEKALLVNKPHKHIEGEGRKRPSKSQEPSSQKLAALMKITRTVATFD
jgi:hypothetical protein